MFDFAHKKQYARASDKELLSNFRSENWEKLSVQKRIAVLQEVENRNAANQGRSPCTVKSTDSKNEYGCYYPGSHQIEVNVNDYIKSENGERISNPSYQVLDTVYHEGEHAHQTNCVDKQISPPQGLPQTTRDMCQVESSGNNYRDVIAYDYCTCELDSNNVAATRVMESREIFRGDPKYDVYLADREAYFQQAANPDMSAVRMQQSEAIYQAYKNGDISLEQHDAMLLHEVRSEQPAFREAKSVYEKVKNERAVIHENSERADAKTARPSEEGSRIYAEYTSAEKGYREAYEKGDMKAAHEYQEKMDKAMSEVKGKDVRKEQGNGVSEADKRPDGSGKARG